MPGGPMPPDIDGAGGALRAGAIAAHGDTGMGASAPPPNATAPPGAGGGGA